MKIMAFDPGGTTGWASYKTNPHNAEGKWDGGQFPPVDHHLGLWDFLFEEEPDIIVYEAFNYQIRRSQGTDMPGVVLMSREYIGVITLYHQYHAESTKLVKQQPSIIGLAWLKDPALKKLGLHTSGTPHQNDATRHLLYYLVTELGRQDLLEPLR